jgi:hypothetical protein
MSNFRHKVAIPCYPRPGWQSINGPRAEAVEHASRTDGRRHGLTTAPDFPLGGTEHLSS